MRKSTISSEISYFLDNDEDGLPDWYEITTLYPIVFNKNGSALDITLISPDDDYDDDGLTNFKEYTLNTSPGNNDTDGDGLSDGDELNKYSTNPLLYDTDKDELGDAAELLNNLDPLNSDTNGNGIIDGKERFENQKLIPSVYKYINNDETLVMPSIEITGVGDYSKQIYCEDSYQDKTFADLDYLVGHIIEIKHPDDMKFESAVISFKIHDSILSKYSINELSIVRLDPSTGEVVPVETSIDQTNNTISAKVDKLCYYGVEVKNLRLQETDIDNTASVIDSGKTDIIFVIDTTGSMDEAINNVYTNVSTFVDKLEAENVDVRLGLIEYKDIYKDGTNSTQNHSWYYDVEKFKNELSMLNAVGGGDEAESAVDALYQARNMGSRSNVNKHIILITDAPYKNGIAGSPSYTMKNEISNLVSANYTVSVVSYSSVMSDYNELVTTTHGVFGNIEQNFATTLDTLILKIGEEVNDGIWVDLQIFD